MSKSQRYLSTKNLKQEQAKAKGRGSNGGRPIQQNVNPEDGIPYTRFEAINGNGVAPGGVTDSDRSAGASERKRGSMRGSMFGKMFSGVEGKGADGDGGAEETKTEV